MPTPSSNPLKKYFRQPKLYLKLPSNGNFYPQGTLEKTETGEYPVFPMTARDEIAIKTPDALLNGQATVDVIHSCVPNIKNAWDVPTIDIDALLIAIRIATYGESLDVDVRLPNTQITKTYTTDLRLAVDQLINAVYDPELDLPNGMKVLLKPTTYKQYTQNAIKTLEEQRLFRVVNNTEMSEEQRVELFNDSFKKITDITMSVVSRSISKIITPDGEEITNVDHIKEFIDNAEKDVYKKLIEHIEEQKNKFQMPMFDVNTTEEEQEQGAPEHFKTPIVLDSSNFFV